MLCVGNGPQCATVCCFCTGGYQTATLVNNCVLTFIIVDIMKAVGKRSDKIRR